MIKRFKNYLRDRQIAKYKKHIFIVNDYTNEAGKRVFEISTGNLSKRQCENYLRLVMSKYKQWTALDNP